MATFDELRALFGYDDLRKKIEVAVIVAAEAIHGEDPATANHANRLKWAKAAFISPLTMAKQMVMAVLATNKDFTVEQITGALDATIQAKVDAAVDLFADGT